MNCKKILSFIIIGLGITTSLNAQITLTSKDDLNKPGAINTMRSVVIDDNVDIPTRGANQTWDFSKVLITDKGYSDTLITPPASDGFKDATVSKAFNQVFFNLVPQMGHDFYKLDENGYHNLGRHFKRSVAKLSAKDSLTILEQDVKYIPKPYINYAYPLEFGKTWGNDVTFTSNNLLDYPDFGLNSAKLDYRTITTTNDTVVGWGKLTLPSGTYDALLVSTTYASTDSIYLNGQPAPDILLSVAGIKNGAKVVAHYYKYFVPGFNSWVLSVATNEKGDSVSSASLNKNASIVGIPERLADETVNVYPNPVENNQITITYTASKDGKIDILNLMGQNVGTYNLKNGVNHITFSNKLTAGTYLYRVTDTATGSSLTRQIIVK